jgi:hypothetical protein
MPPTPPHIDDSPGLHEDLFVDATDISPRHAISDGRYLKFDATADVPAHLNAPFRCAPVQAHPTSRFFHPQMLFSFAPTLICCLKCRHHFTRLTIDCERAQGQ